MLLAYQLWFGKFDRNMHVSNSYGVADEQWCYSESWNSALTWTVKTSVFADVIKQVVDARWAV